MPHVQCSYVSLLECKYGITMGGWEINLVPPNYWDKKRNHIPRKKKNKRVLRFSMISNSGSAWYFMGQGLIWLMIKGFLSLDLPLELGWCSWSPWSNGWSNGGSSFCRQKPHGTHLLLLLLHRILRSTTDLARDGVNLPATQDYQLLMWT